MNQWHELDVMTSFVAKERPPPHFHRMFDIYNVLLYYSQIAVNIHGLCLDNRSAYGVKYSPLFWGHRTLSFVFD